MSQENENDMGSFFQNRVGVEDEIEVKNVQPVEQDEPDHQEDIQDNPEALDKKRKHDVEPERKDKRVPNKDIEPSSDDDAEPSEKAKPVEKINYKEELEKIQRRHKEAEKWGNDARKQLATYKKLVNKFKEDGILTDEDAETLADHTKYEEVAPNDESMLQKLARICDPEIEQMRKYSAEPEKIDQYIHSFQNFINYSEPSEIREAMDELAELEDSPVAFTKKMLEIGRDYNEEVFDDLYKAGSLKNFKVQFNKKIEELNKELDKKDKIIEKYKKKYEDYTEQNHNLPYGGSGKSMGTKETDIGNFISSR